MRNIFVACCSYNLTLSGFHLGNILVTKVPVCYLFFCWLQNIFHSLIHLRTNIWGNPNYFKQDNISKKWDIDKCLSKCDLTFYFYQPEDTMRWNNFKIQVVPDWHPYQFHYKCMMCNFSETEFEIWAYLGRLAILKTAQPNLFLATFLASLLCFLGQKYYSIPTKKLQSLKVENPIFSSKFNYEFKRG